MKILNLNNPTQKTLLDKVYTCELSGWEIAAVTALIRRFAAGDPNNTLRGHCLSVEEAGMEIFPCLKNSHKLFAGGCFSEESEQALENLQ